MAHWAAKAPTEVVEREWTVPGLLSATISATGITVDGSEQNGDTLIVTLSGGTSMGVVTITATTSDGETLVEKFYIPIAAQGNAFSGTARDCCYFALRKITGNGENPDADEMDDALERMNAMLAAWHASGGQTYIPLPVVAGTILYAPDGYIETIKYSLRVGLHEHYGVPVSPFDVTMARDGIKRIKQAELPDDRAAADYF